MAEVFVPILIPNFTPIYISFSLSFTFFDYSKRSLSFRKWNFVTTWNMTTVTARYANLNRELSTLFLLKKEKEKINSISISSKCIRTRDFFLETWTSTLAPHTLQSLILIEWLSCQECVVVCTNWFYFTAVLNIPLIYAYSWLLLALVKTYLMLDY